ncbi:DUF4328 domain-containing protein [Herbidospora cretacea]|uniref:DUF4328 domain-containing protein n=1 Tax=Herbidospora cretacea TaxID=28444 RepID=UPI0009DF0E80|nr:DUF4328 domain-containing protein [Herbidospora cretacea]
MYPAPAPIRPARGLAVAVAIAIALNLLIETLAVFVSWTRYDMIGGIIADPLSADIQAVDDNDSLYAFTGILQFATLLLAGVVYWIWLFRVRDNAEILSPYVPQRKAKPWLIFGWLVPIISFWFPKQIVDDIWQASDPQQRKPGGLAMTWWLTWIVSAIASNLVGRFLISGEELSDLQTAALLEVIFFPLTLISGILAIMVVNRITALQAIPRQPQAPQYPQGQPFPQGQPQQYGQPEYGQQQYGQQAPPQQYPPQQNPH